MKKAVGISRTVLEGVTYVRALPPPQRAKWIVGRVQDMGPTYVKLGQFLSSRADIIGPEVIDALKRLQDSSKPLPWSEVKKVVNADAGAGRGGGGGAAGLAWVDEFPLASASIGQVHKGRLADGTEVVVKVRRPGIVGEIGEDIRLLDGIFDAMGFTGIGMDKVADCKRIVADLKRMIMNETDFEREVANMELMIAQYPDILIPRPCKSLCNSEMIVMTYVPSVKLSGVGTGRRQKLAYALMDSFVQQFLQHGLIHGDPHEGNVALSSVDESQNMLVMYDLGHIVQLDARVRSLMKVLVFELMTENVDGVVDAIELMPEIIRIRDKTQIRTFIKRYIEYVKTIDIKVLSSLDSRDENLPVQFSSVVFEIVRIFGIVEGICLTLDPKFEYSQVFMRYVDTLVLDRDFLEYKAGRDLEKIMDWFQI